MGIKKKEKMKNTAIQIGKAICDVCFMHAEFPSSAGASARVLCRGVELVEYGKRILR